MRRLPGPDGDRRHSPQSGSIEDQVSPLINSHNHVMRVLVLGEDLVNRSRWALGPPPGEDAVEGAQVSQLVLEIGQVERRQSCVVGERDAHIASP